MGLKFCSILLLLCLVAVLNGCLAQLPGYVCGSPCSLPDCICPSKINPGKFHVEKTPQIVLLTFDDAITGPAATAISEIFDAAIKSHNGCPLRSTFFAQTDYTDYYLAQKFAFDGHEIATHTMTHSTGSSTSSATWNAELNGMRKAMLDLSNIPSSSIRGARAPNLAYSDVYFQSLKENKFLYDLSIGENDMLWPFTQDWNSPTNQPTNCWGGSCPQSNPGLWQIPNWSLMKSGNAFASMDPAGNYLDVLTLFKENFGRRYNSQRAPFGIFLHAAWLLADQAHVYALLDFLRFASSLPNVYFVTGTQLINYMQQPLPTNLLTNSLGPFSCNTTSFSNIAAPCSKPRTCSYPSGLNFRTCASSCPSSYPAPSSTVSAPPTPSPAVSSTPSPLPSPSPSPSTSPISPSDNISGPPAPSATQVPILPIPFATPHPEPPSPTPTPTPISVTSATATSGSQPPANANAVPASSDASMLSVSIYPLMIACIILQTLLAVNIDS